MTQSVLYPLLGGALIGASAAATLVLVGRIAGIAGIVGGLLWPARGEWQWRAAFLAGLLAVGAASAWLTPQAGARSFVPPAGILIAAGLLVGFGSRLGSGCTSGHGVCGVSRLSVRSIAATAIFVATAMLTVAVFPQGWRAVP